MNAPLLCSIVLAGSVIACGSVKNETTDAGSDAGSSIDAGPRPAIAAMPSLELQPIKTFHFAWTDVSDATHYKLLENASGDSEFIQVGGEVAAGEQSVDLVVPLYARVSAKYILQSCNAGGCVDSDPVEVSGTLVEAVGYVKASNTDAGDWFGHSVALSSDGSTIVVGACREAGNATGIGGDQANNSASNAGAVYVYGRTGMAWSQQAYLKASNTDAGDSFGCSVSVSDDGNVVAVGPMGKPATRLG